jgi:uncharacterized membrane protein
MKPKLYRPCLALFSIGFCLSLSMCNKVGESPNPSIVFANDTISMLNVNYSNFVNGILKKNCSTCHAASGSAAAWWVNTNTYANCTENYQKITTTILNQTMPPSPKFPFSERDRALLDAWVKRGLPENN